MVNKIILLLLFIPTVLFAQSSQPRPYPNYTSSSLTINGSLANDDSVWTSKQAKCFYEINPALDKLVMLFAPTNPTNGGVETDLSGTGKIITYNSGEGWSSESRITLTGQLGDSLYYPPGADPALQVTSDDDFEMMDLDAAVGANITEVETDCGGVVTDNQTICFDGAHGLGIGDVIKFDVPGAGTTQCGITENQQYIIRNVPNATSIKLCDEGYGASPCTVLEDLSDCCAAGCAEVTTLTVTKGQDIDFSFLGWMYTIDPTDNAQNFLGHETNTNDQWKSFPNYDIPNTFYQGFHVLDRWGNNAAKADCGRAEDSNVMTAGVWYNLAYAYDTSQGANIEDRLLMWKDGVAGSSYASTSTNCANYATMHDVNSPLNIGSDETGNGLSGYMGMIGLYKNYVITDEDAQRFYNCSRGYYGK